MAGETPHQLAVALVTANLDYRIKADGRSCPAERRGSFLSTASMSTCGTKPRWERSSLPTFSRR
jgi:hypothetical protein